MNHVRRGLTLGGLALLVLAAGGCGHPVLSSTQPTADALAREVLTAIAGQDQSQLDALALNEEEFRRVVWPSLPAARPERNLPFSYVWGDLHQKSNTRLRAMLGAHAGRRYAFQALTFSGGSTSYPGFVVHRDAVLTVRDSGGVDHELRLFGSALEKDGAWKVFSFNTDD